MSALVLLLASVPTAPSPVPEVKVPPGFTISTYADNPLAPDIYTLTIDDAGRILVAGRGYVRVLVDDNGDDVADRAIDLIDGLKDGPMGLLAEGDSLYVVSEGGLQRYRGYNGRDKLKQPPETLLKLKTMGEHDAHMVRRGPDGWLYLLCGNSAGVSKATITSRRSPVTDPVAGALLRISPDGKEVEVVSDGFRNPYSFDFNIDGEPFASDSDNERCVGLPWYEPCRFYHLIPGGNYGWRSPQVGKFWRKPPYFIDCVPPVCYLGRGSPTGVACYRHTHFPEKYQGGFFLADWTFGRIDFIPLRESGSTYTGKPEVFAEAMGTSGFAPTGLCVHPKTGELFVSIGGRGTRGGVYRIAHNEKRADKALSIARHSLDWSAEAGKKWLATVRSETLGTEADQRDRRHSLEMMARYREKMPWGEPLFAAVKPCLAFPDTYIRLAAARAAQALIMPTGQISDIQMKLLLAYGCVKDDPSWSLKVAIEALMDSETSLSLKLQAVRVVQLAYGDITAPGTAGTIWEGYTLRDAGRRIPSPDLLKAIGKNLESDDANLNREAARTLAALNVSDMRLTSVITRTLMEITDKSTVESDIHYLAIYGAIIRGAYGLCNEWDTRRVTNSLLGMDAKVTRDKISRDQNWPLRFEEILETLGRANPAIGLELLKHPDFGRPEHLILVKPLHIPSYEAAKRFLKASEKDPAYAWTPGLVQLMGALPLKETRPLCAKLWEQPHLRDSIVALLANEPTAADRDHFLHGLGSFDPGVVRIAINGLSKLPKPTQPAELAAAIKALRRASPEDKTTREAIAGLLQQWSGEKLPADPKPWTEWLVRKHPEAAKLLNASDGFDAAAWKKREAAIPWTKGDAIRGRVVFTKATCAACHDGARALGPSLQGASKRFSRDDLLTAVLDPSKDVSPRYRPVRLGTTDDNVYIGMVIYEATDGVMLQTGADTVIRIPGEKIASRRPVDVSLMPAGLLDKLTDAEVADLFAYLRTN